MTPGMVASGVALDGFEMPSTSYSGSRAGALVPLADTNSRALEPSVSTLAGCRYSGSVVNQHSDSSIFAVSLTALIYVLQRGRYGLDRGEPGRIRLS